MAYVLPQVQVFQEFSQLPRTTVQNLNTFVFGPNYGLFRYAEDSEKALIGLGSYDRDNDTEYDYPNQPAGSNVDVDYAKLYGEDIWLKYINIAQSATNPIVMVGTSERNKLRAAPRVGDAVGDSSVTMNAAGYFIGMVALPEAYYFVPSDQFDLGTAVGELNYITTENLSGSVDIPADAVTAGVEVQGPHGLVFDFDNAATVNDPRVITFEDGGAAGSFTLSLISSKLKDQIDDQIDNTLPMTVVINNAAGALSAAYVHATRTLTLDIAPADTLTAVQAALAAPTGDTADYILNFAVSSITGVGTGTAIVAADQDATDVSAATVEMIPDCWKVSIFENTNIFKTANGYSRTASLLKDVEIGDKLQYVVTPASTGVEVSGLSTVVGLEADYSLPALADAEASTDNQITQLGDDLSSAKAIEAGVDNQRAFDGVNTGALAADGFADYRYPSYALGLLNETLIISITKGGAAGTAEALVTNASGTYYRNQVPIQAAGADNGQIYVGGNVYINFDQGGSDPDAEFKVGDSYTVEIGSPFTAVAVPTVDGDYTGQQDTTFNVQITRGGVFDRVSHVIDGLANTTDHALTTDITGWLAGDVDDEMILECTYAGSITNAVFKLTTQRGENITSIAFAGYGAANAIAIGATGLQAYFTENTTDFAVGDYFSIVVKAARPQARVTDRAGIDQETIVIVNNAEEIELGLTGGTVTFPANLNTMSGIAPNGGMVKGDYFSVDATASQPGAVQTIVLADDLPEDVAGGFDENGDANYAPDLLELDLFLVKNSAEVPKEDHNPAHAAGMYNWENDEDIITVNSGITMQDSRWVDSLGDMPYLDVFSMDMFSEYRALLTEYVNTVYSISDISDVTNYLGVKDPDNPLAFGVDIALQNSGSTTVYFMALPSDDEDGWRAVLDKATLTDAIYCFNPLTTDQSIHSIVEAHINDMSDENNKRWRIGFVGNEMPTTSPVLTAATNAGVEWQATITDDPRVGGDPQYTRVELTEPSNLLADQKPGDEVRLAFSVDAWGNETYITDTVAEVYSNTVFYLNNGLSAEITQPQKIETYHPLDTAEKATAIAAQSTGYANRRMYNVFPSNLGAFGTYVDAIYGASAVAGLCSSVVPQQGLTNIEINGFDDIPVSYSMFSQAQLNEIAEGGTLIIMQETQGGTVYVRHQLSTAAYENNLNTAELSITKNLDSISYYFAGILQPFIGRYNVTPELIEVIKTNILNGINYLGSYTSVGLLGPQLILDNTSIRTVEQHPTLKDRIVAIIDVELPYPVNVIEMHIVV